MNDWFSADELAALKLPGYPRSGRRMRDRAKTEGWLFREIPSKGRTGYTKEYAPPASVMQLIGVAKSANSDTEMKDHEIRELVNDLRDIAKTYGQTEQLRERIAHRIVSELQIEEAFIVGLRKVVTTLEQHIARLQHYLDWIASQGDEFQSGVIHDAEFDGEIFVFCMSGYYHAPTFREALDLAMAADKKE